MNADTVQEDVLTAHESSRENWPFKYSVGVKGTEVKSELKIPPAVEKKFRLAQLKTFKLQAELRKLEIKISEAESKPVLPPLPFEDALL